MRVFLAALATIAIALFTQFNIAQAMTMDETPACFVASEGIYRGSWVKHRIYVNEDVVFGANDLGSILNQLENLRGQGTCR
ncbi:hypothetical protein AZI86_09825 [Bdellovibrio bacteriovorus]|uniref:Uncharacterized protein n=1 Tax=Bdellovibrio bacteriovorus TaxID=959 RepID=A0A150WSE1_BDEBC|nr:hypothetical protein [Bdellovibrio bacteriovorus]KYG67288.1 hypothetical protein AZI86_09825 [Bdellovibrio bacteriovorus]